MASSCPECGANVGVGNKPMAGEIVQCPDCGTELEVKNLQPLELAVAPAEEEDWGE
ncbi:MAG: lysine biosynthesis protein LysW [Chloroflexi bacterium]|nr:MAG: lysine biosynthesis protein LysW [Chloroflexota bacterium]